MRLPGMVAAHAAFSFSCRVLFVDVLMGLVGACIGLGPYAGGCAAGEAGWPVTKPLPRALTPPIDIISRRSADAD